MSSYKNNKDGTLTPIATNTQITDVSVENFVTQEELAEKADKEDITDMLTITDAEWAQINTILT